MAPDGKTMPVEMDEEILYQYVEDGSITVHPSNTYCTGVKLKIHSQLADSSLVLTQIRFTIARERFLEDNDGRVVAEFKRITFPKECEIRFGACQADNTAYLFEEKPNQCPFKIVRGINVKHDNERVTIDQELSLLFNLTIPKRINAAWLSILHNVRDYSHRCVRQPRSPSQNVNASRYQEFERGSRLITHTGLYVTSSCRAD